MKRQLVLVIILLVIFLVVLDVTQVEARRMRPFPEAVDEIKLLFQALQRGPVSGSGPNGCTNIPRGSGRCHNG
ncbi:hypothetical protein F2Q70_00008207 [Brassica cretica]|uniref:Transmembrane protein n=5 Tax=Brassica TaxID=3705 RepID=A0ABQ8A9W4_BRANA|nr:PREDICTED: uncharacterized protein LOC106331350 [Brassica oleracea var. oleracea]XP_013746600.1 uncharacterized protein LOC106449377 [Brassica napus]KAF2579722.1 hypothetical protein F2Q68_00001241 [Brassica cretica]KAG2296759.1 hypothetical protein Bca52824_043428 [Brassica carinata]KAF2615895.1 hypothetical protein F2Q70_00008207 [Brassica cretica]KAF3547935.1 hypothetical protein DY000_02001655 [Brassica cretica]KAH0889316.1 hypothetical protein HID58_051745 [Brassica napus]